MIFDWDTNKAARNANDHKITFDVAKMVFDDPFFIVFPDPVHSFDESRYLILGETSFGQLMIVSYTERGDAVRIISAREATPKERRKYEKEKSRSSQ